MVDRNEVFAAISEEREYQHKRWGVRQPDSSMREPLHSVGDFILYMEDYLAEARGIESRTAGGNPKSLGTILKVITLGVACLEQHGVVVRPSGKVINERDQQPT